MTEVVVEREIAAAPERVWAVVADPTAQPGVFGSVLRVEPVTPGPVGPGSRWQETRRLLGHEVTQEVTVVEVRAPELFAAASEREGVRFTTEFHLAPGAVPGRTATRVVFRADASGLRGRLVLAAMSAASTRVREAIEADLADLARACEGADADTA